VTHDDQGFDGNGVASPRGTAMDRREAIRVVGLLLGGTAFVGGSTLLSACAGDRAPVPMGADGSIGRFSAADQAFLAEVAEAILPETAKSPGAKAAGCGPFMALMVTDCYTPEDQAIFREGMAKVEAACRSAHGTGFLEATADQKLAVVQQLDAEQHAYMKARKPGDPTHAFRMMKELACLGFFTSEIGYTKAMRYVETPGRYDPCVPYAAGETSWAPHA
jgi:hypothetical protein